MGRRFGQLVLTLLLTQHVVHLFFFLGGPDLWRSPLPILVHDHAYVAYNGKVAARALKDSWTTAAYDPHFMAGYVNSVISSSNGVLPLVVLAAGESNYGIAYKFYSLAAAALLPLLVYWAARGFGWQPSEAVAATAIWMLAFWGSGKAWRYIDYGMIAFVTSLGWVLVVGALAARFFERPSAWRAACLGITAGICCLWHTTAAILLAPPCIVLLLLEGRRLSAVGWLELLAAIGICIAMNAPWLAPLPTVWPTLGATPRFFVNPNVVERLIDIFRLEDESVTTPLLAALAGATVACSRLSRSGKTVLAVSLAWTFFLAYPAGWLRSLDVLQPGRNTFAFSTWLCLPAGGWLTALWTRGRARWFALTAALVASYYLYANVPSIALNFHNVATSPLHRMPSRLPALHAQMIADMRTHFRTCRRVFYEDCNNGVPDVPNPFFTFRPSALLHDLTGLEIVGGPYLQTHYQTQNVQAGDGKLMGQTEWTDSDFERWTRAFDIGGIVCWSPQLTSYCLARPKRFMQRFRWQDGTSGATIYGFAIEPKPVSNLGLGVGVSAAVDRITVDAAAKPAQAVVLPYHWQPGLFGPDGAALRPRYQDGCPAPFIEIDAAGGTTTIRFDPLAWWRRPQTLRSPAD